MENHRQIYTLQHSVRHKDNRGKKGANLTKICQIKKQNLINLKKKMSEKKNPRNLELICSSVDIKEEP